ncbi:polyprenyl synthetase family protein [Streptomyces filamentosus]|uniref:polyprenyl synthetase family protein n=1 Tax=Streptomyces filamentosus TaxID=67294 RepID=UPI0037D2146E
MASGRPVEEYLEMLRLKTAVLASAACRIGATLAGAADPAATALTAYGEDLGMAFQIRDDLLPYATRPEAAGGPTDSN